MRRETSLYLPEPVKADKIRLYRKSVALIWTASFAVMFVASISPDLLGLSESMDSLMTTVASLMTLVFLVSSFLLMASTSKDISKLDAEDLSEMVDMSQQNKEILSFSRKIKEQGRSPVGEDLKVARRYLNTLENREKQKNAESQWASLGK